MLKLPYPDVFIIHFIAMILQQNPSAAAQPKVFDGFVFAVLNQAFKTLTSSYVLKYKCAVQPVFYMITF